MADGITSGAILKRMVEMVRQNIGLAVGVIVGLTAVSVVMEMLTGPAGRGNMFVAGIATVLAQYLITKKVMEQRGIDSSGAGGYRATGFGAVFGVCLLSNLGIILGLILLIVPGVFLAIRWFAAVPAVIGEDVSVTGALAESWSKTKGHGSAIFGAMVVIYLPFLIAMWLAIGITASVGEGGIGQSAMTGLGVAINVLTSLAAVVGWHAAIAFWELRAPATPALVEVFA